MEKPTWADVEERLQSAVDWLTEHRKKYLDPRAQEALHHIRTSKVYLDAKQKGEAAYKNALTAHYLRHGYATMLYEAGIDEKEAAVFMGHKDEEMIRKVYAHLRNKKKTTAAELLKEKTKHGLVGIGEREKQAAKQENQA